MSNEPKITILPPQKAPRTLTANRGIPNLGEHKLAFLNANNRSGWMMDDIPEEPIAEHLAALWLIVIGNMPGVNEIVTRHPEPRRKHLVDREVHAGTHLSVQRKVPKRTIVPVKPATKPSAPSTLSVRDNAFKKHFVATRVAASAIAVHKTPLQDYEYVARKKKLHDLLVTENKAVLQHQQSLLGDKLDAEWKKFQQSLTGDERRVERLMSMTEEEFKRRKLEVLRMEAALKAIDRSFEYTVSAPMNEIFTHIDRVISRNQLLQSVAFRGYGEPKSDASGNHRINPYLR